MSKDKVTAKEMRERINAAYRELAGLVGTARGLRMQLRYDEQRCVMDRADDLHERIHEMEAELETLERGVVSLPLLRDPEADPPENGFVVVAVTDDKDAPVVLAYHSDDGWFSDEVDEPMDGSVIGWCWAEEAADMMREAKREVARG